MPSNVKVLQDLARGLPRAAIARGGPGGNFRAGTQEMGPLL